MRSRILAVSLGCLAAALCGPAAPARALFQQTVIDEVVASYDGDPGQQYIELRMVAAGQGDVAHGVLALFDASGAYVQDLLVIPTNVANTANGSRWLVATPDFQDVHLAADFTMPQHVLPAGGGMICFGGGTGALPQNPPSWSRTDFANYADCLAYGNYGGSANVLTGTPTTRAPLDHALQRGAETHDNATDFACSDALTPTTNAGASVGLVSTIPCACGNGAVSGDEDCDDGNQIDGDCCSNQCDNEVFGSPCPADVAECTQDICNGAGVCVHPPFGSGTPCSADAIECTEDVCDGLGSCSHPVIPPGGPCTSDGNVCTDDVCDGAVVCVHPSNTAPCDDDDLCTPVDTCNGGICVGDQSPRAGCRLPTQPGKATLAITNDVLDTKDRMTWKWTKGVATLGDVGDPLAATDYALCIYDRSGPSGADRLRLSARAPHGGTCAGKPCWKATSSGAKYGDKELTPDGARTIGLKAGATGGSTITVKGQGAGLGVSGLPFTTPITVQLVTSDAACFGASYGATLPSSDPARTLKAKSD